MSTHYVVDIPSVSDIGLFPDAIIEVRGGSSLSGIFSSDQVILDSGASVNVGGSGNTITGSDSANVFVWGGSGNVISVGAHSSVVDVDDGETVTIGADSMISLYGNNSTLNATNGNDRIYASGTGNVINAVNDSITVRAGASFTLSGSNNSISMDNLNDQGATVRAGAFTLTQDQGGIVVTGGVNPGAIALINGVVTVQLGNGNVATINNVTSGSTFKYVDSSGKATTTTLTDAGVLYLGGTLYEVTGSVMANQSNAIFQVDNGASLDLTASHSQVITNDGTISIQVTGDGNTVVGGSTNGTHFQLSGSANVLSIGDGDNVLDTQPFSPFLSYGTYVSDSGYGTTLTIGKNVAVAEFGTNATINALKGGDSIVVGGTGNTVNANNDTILVQASLSLSGSNNQLSMDNRYSPGVTVTTKTASLTEDGSGITLTGTANVSSVTLTDGNATVQLGDGNVATITQVASGETLTYVDASGKQTTTTLMDSNLLHVAGNLYNVNGNVLANLSNSIFDVLSGASLNVNGASDTVILSAGAGYVGIAGTGNTLIGSSVSAANVQVQGVGNIVSVGANGNILDWGTGNTDTVGAGGYVRDGGNGNTVNLGVGASLDSSDGETTINATQGGAQIRTTNGSGATLWGRTINANGASIDMETRGERTTINGDNNQIIDHDRITDLFLNGSNNSLSMDSMYGLGGGIVSMGTTGSLSVGSGSSSGTNVVTLYDRLNYSGSATLTNGVLTLQLGNGNVATISNVASGTTFEYYDYGSNHSVVTTLQDTRVGASQLLGASRADTLTSQLVAAMASYTSNDVAAATTGFQMSANSAFHDTLVASSIH
ncbi:hypothetical protein NK8_64900 (plasmid) [Caballeronia sp. NK8]|uniref:beta strand repeat-containing protein n=1 Tax=Caballeronia sp. NK8 TaxID=140098 RepID=UPI001BB76988|nr:hypothetical protein [Caballeronia sp. NK8]BCQ28301.1 hypothetical protein NK8_64900 [Caballeronia sp. NK8]